MIGSAEVSQPTISQEICGGHRNLVTIRTISELRPIQGADRIELAIVDGWQCVTQKGQHKVGDRVVYFEIDSFIPMDPIQERFAFLAKDTITWEGKFGTRIRTMKLRKQLSQGLILPLKDFPEIVDWYVSEEEECDLAPIIGVLKWERSIPANLAGRVRGNFPMFIFKTNQERIQNFFRYFRDPHHMFEVTKKLDGSSLTAYYIASNGHFGVCSHNLELEESEDNAFWKVVNKYCLREKLPLIGRNIAIQAELVGPGVQKNRLQLPELDMYVFDIFDIDKHEYLPSGERLSIVEDLTLKHVPFANPDKPHQTFDFQSVDEALASVGTDSTVEGHVWKSITDTKIHFKILNNEYLLKYGD